MARTVADFITESLKAIGVKRVYGVVGDSLNGFTDALRRIGGIDWIHMRHEEAAAFAAGAEAHLTGALAVCAGSCGPGNLHLINGLFDCHRSRVPVLAIAAHTPSSEIGIDYFQPTHPASLFTERGPSVRRAVSACGPDEALALAKLAKAPVVHALRGKEFIEYDNPHDVGLTGLRGCASGYAAMMSCDTLLMLGTDFPYRQFYPEHA